MKIWQNILKDYEYYLKLERNMSENTCKAYISDMDKFISFLKYAEIKISPQEITREHLLRFIDYIVELGLSDKTQSRFISALKSFFKYIVLEDLRKDDPSDLVEMPKLGRKLPEVLSVSEIEEILKSIDVSNIYGHRNRAIIEVLYGCGLRVSELVNLKISNIFPNEEYVKVIGKGDKQRIVPIGKLALSEIENYLISFRNKLNIIHKGHTDYLFLNRRGRKLTREMIFTIVKTASINAGISKQVSPHIFRHSFATHLVEGGADLRVVQDLLGHESITTTEIYTHLDKEYLREVIIQYHPRS